MNKRIRKKKNGFVGNLPLPVLLKHRSARVRRVARRFRNLLNALAKQTGGVVEIVIE